MSEDLGYDGRRERRSGLSRFVVPHESFAWLTRSIGVMALGTGILVGAAAWVYHFYLFQSLGLPEATLGHLVERYMRFTIVNAVMVALTSAIYITMMAAYLFHKVSGPIYRIERHMMAVISGRAEGECKLRSSDQLQGMCSTYNELLHSLDAIEPKPLIETATDGSTVD